MQSFAASAILSLTADSLDAAPDYLGATPLLAYTLLGGAATAYAASNLLLSRGSTAGVDAGTGLIGALRHPAYLAGTAGQGLGFLLALAARRDLPLLVVQSGITASLALTAVAGALLGRWRLGWSQLAGVTAVVAGLALVASAGRAGPAADPGPGPLLGCVAAMVLSLVAISEAALSALGVPARARPSLRGLASGVGFGASAVGARVIMGTVIGDPAGPAGLPHVKFGAIAAWSLLLLVGGVIAGQLLLTAALGSGAVTGPIAAMHLVETAAPAAVGVAFLGDLVTPGGGWAAAAGVALAVTGALLLAGHDRPARDAQPEARDAQPETGATSSASSERTSPVSPARTARRPKTPT